MKLILLLILLFGVICCQQSSDDVLELISQAGFTGEAHQVQTEDGYILKVHRVLPRGKPVSKLPVLLMHGMLVTAATFVLAEPENSLAFLLSDAGYDVWMGNTRGTKHSMNHTTLSIDSSEFWTFSFHEMGFYDLPTMIDFMLKKTGARKLFYVGHSQGCSDVLVLLSMRPEYNEKIMQTHLMSPGALSTNIKHPFIGILMNGARDGMFGDYRFINLKPLWTLLQELFCSQPIGSFDFAICEASALATAGPNKRKFQMDRKVLQKYILHMSPRLAVMQVVHYVQIHFSRKLQSFDYRWKHFEKKNFTKPIDYDLLKITSATYLYAGNVDMVVSDTDTETLKNLLPNVKKFQVIDDWNHYDFTFSKDPMLYNIIIKEIESENKMNF